LKRIYATFPGDDITLEGVWHMPESSSPVPAVIVCHPHPLYGGSMSNNAVIAICHGLAQVSIAAFRFNFRGVGKSEGTHGEGVSEQDDIRAALEYIATLPNIDMARVGLAGYSFGASVALPVAMADERVKLLTLVSPALTDDGWEQLKECTKPKFIIIGNDDFVIPVPILQKHIVDVPEPRHWQVISGADHFWLQYEEELAKKVTGFFQDGFKQLAESKK